VVNRYQSNTAATPRDVTITAVSATAQAFVIPHGERHATDTSTGQEELFEYRLTSTTNVQIVVDSADDAAANTIYFEVVDWNNADINVQHINNNAMTSTETTDTATITAVTLAKTWLIVTGRTEAGAFSEQTGRMNFRADLQNTTTVRVQSGVAYNWSAQIIEDVSTDGIWDTQIGNISMTTAETSDTLALSPAVDTANTFVSGTAWPHFAYSGQTEDTLTSNQDTASATVTLTNSTTITAVRGTNFNDTANVAFDIFVQSVDFSSAAGATFAKAEDTVFTGATDADKFPRTTTFRIRFEVSNEGATGSGGVTYQLQVAETGTCSSGTYSAVPTTSGDHWQIVDSTNITDGEATANISPGLTDEATTFVAGELKDTGNTTSAITLAADAFTEMEYAVQATANSTDLGNYCFRLFDTTGNTTLDTYTKYAEAVVVPEYLWMFFGLGPLLPGFISRIKRRKRT